MNADLGAALRDVGGEPLPGRQELLFIHDVVAIKDRPRLVAGQQHGDSLGYARADQVPGGGASTIVEEPMWDLGRPTRVAERGAPLANGHAVPAKHARVLRLLPATAPREDLLQGWGDRQDAAGSRLGAPRLGAG